MTKISTLTGPRGTTLAYAYTPGTGPCVVFLSGYRSDMEGTKAVHMEAWARSQGRAFLRLDYSGHGQSGGAFEDGCIGDWADDAEAVIRHATTGPVVLVGSSMGGWISCLLSGRLEVAGFVGIAAAPDFTEEGFWANLTEDQRRIVMEHGRYVDPDDADAFYVITRKVIEDGRANLVFTRPLPMGWPVRLLQGTLDEAVTRDTALRLLDHIDGDDVRLTFVKHADHRFSTPECLSLVEQAVLEVIGQGRAA